MKNVHKVVCVTYPVGIVVHKRGRDNLGESRA